jgi:hypothetical protein
MSTLKLDMQKDLRLLDEGDEYRVGSRRYICPALRVLPVDPDRPSHRSFVFLSAIGVLIEYTLDIAEEQFNMAFADIHTGSGACHRTTLADLGFVVSPLPDSWIWLLHYLLDPVTFNRAILPADDYTVLKK